MFVNTRKCVSKKRIIKCAKCGLWLNNRFHIPNIYISCICATETTIFYKYNILHE